MLKQAVVIYVSGDVKVTRGRQATTVGIGDALAAGQTVETGPGSECELRLGTGTAIRIDELTKVRLDEVMLDPGGNRIGMRLVLGNLLCKVGMLSGEERFRVVTPTAVVGVRGTEFGLGVAAGGDTLLSVRQGAVAILPALIDLDELAARLKSDDPEVAAALEELGTAEWIVRDAQEILVTTAAFAAAEESRVQVERAIRAISRTKEPTADEKAAFLAVVRQAAADIRGSVAAPVPVEDERTRSLERIDDLERRMGEALGYARSAPVAVEILNSGFEEPSARFGSMCRRTIGCPEARGSDGGIPGGAREGSSAVWASRLRGGPGNGFFQELGSVYAVGHYRLGVWIIGDARGLVSLAVLGCKDEDGGYRIVGSNSTEAPYGNAAGVSSAGSWREQTLDIDILEGDRVVGKPVWIRLTTATVPTAKLDSDTGRYGDSISWDDVTLTYGAYAGLGE